MEDPRHEVAPQPHELTAGNAPKEPRVLISPLSHWQLLQSVGPQ